MSKILGASIVKKCSLLDNKKSTYFINNKGNNMDKKTTANKQEKRKSSLDWKTLLKTTYSNQAVLDSRRTKWYIVLIFFILSVLLPWIPVVSKGYTAKNAAFLTANTNNEIDKGFKSLFQQDYFKTITIDGKQLNLNGLDDKQFFSEDGGWANEYNNTNDKALYKGSYVDVSSNDTNSQVSPVVNRTSGETHTYYFDLIAVSSKDLITKDGTSSSSSSAATAGLENDGYIRYLEAYYFPDLDLKNENFSLYLSNFISSVILDYDAGNLPSHYPHTYMLMTKDTINIASYALKSTKTSAPSATATYSGNVGDAISTMNIITGKSLYDFLFDGTTSVNTAYDNFGAFLHNAARVYAIRNVWINVAMISVVVAASILVCSLILLFVNKRKTSIYHEANYWNCLAEAALMAFTPCLIALAIGFMNFSYEVIAIIGCLLIRVIWSTNKICPPMDSSNSNKPLYQARS